MTSYAQRLESFIRLAETGLREENPQGLLEEIKATHAASPTSDLGSDLEIVFRELLDRLLKSNHMRLERSVIMKLLNYAIQIGVGCSNLSPNFPKIPFLLIEDLLEGQTLKYAASLWEIIESMVDTLTQPELFNRGKFVILRTCNSLLRRLSKSCHTEFCGRVLMFLAAIYPLSERSAVNLMGKVNTSNATGYEDQNIFEANDSIVGTDLKTVTTDWEEEEGATQDQMEMADDTISSPPTKRLKTDSADKSKTRDYSLYRTFWNIQSFLSSDPKTLDAKSSWPSLLTDVETILLTFESDGFRKSEIESAKARREAVIKACASPQDTFQTVQPQHHPEKYMGCKFLTSSQLFALELSDPAIRQQICTQLLILLHHRIKTPPSAAPPSIVSTSRKGPAAPPPEPVLFPSIEELKRLQTRIFSLLEVTPPGGEDLAKTLRTLFCESREDYWMRWKQDHCPSFERTQLDLSVSPAVSGERNKRKASSSSSKRDESFYFEHSLESAQKAVKALSSKVPSFETHITDFLDAEDPEAGIEDEYHPKHDSVYCWRARRLMANHKLSVFEHMADGNIAKGLEILYPKAIPKHASTPTPAASEGTPTAATAASSATETGTAEGRAKEEAPAEERETMTVTPAPASVAITAEEIPAPTLAPLPAAPPVATAVVETEETKGKEATAE